MKVYVLSGSVGVNRCHVEVFEDTDLGLRRGENRKRELQNMNLGWVLDFSLYHVKEGRF